MGGKLRGFIEAECSNWIDCRDPFCNYSGTKRCSVMEGKPCEYFRLWVLPLLEGQHLTESRMKFIRAKEEYSRIDPQALPQQKSARKCKCGEMLLPRYRLCPKCKLKKRRETWRKSIGKSRNAKKAEMSTVNADFTEGKLPQNGNIDI